MISTLQRHPGHTMPETQEVVRVSTSGNIITQACSQVFPWRGLCGARAPLFPPYSFTSSSFQLFYFSLSFIGFTYFLLLSIPSLYTRIVPLRSQAGSRRRRPNLGLVCVLLCNLCYLYSLVKIDCGVLFYLV